jgi:hypothetical protein
MGSEKQSKLVTKLSQAESDDRQTSAIPPQKTAGFAYLSTARRPEGPPGILSSYKAY